MGGDGTGRRGHTTPQGPGQEEAGLHTVSEVTSRKADLSFQEGEELSFPMPHP